MSIVDKLSNRAKITLAGINWEALDIIREIERLENKLKGLDNMSLMVRAIITSNSQMFGKHLSDVNNIKAKIENLEKRLDEIKAEQEAKKKETGEEGQQKEWPKMPDFPPTELEDFEFADDVLSLASIADSLDKRGLHGAADIIDDLIEQKVNRFTNPERRHAKVLRSKLARDEFPAPLSIRDIPAPLSIRDIPAQKNVAPASKSMPVAQLLQQRLEQRLHLQPGVLSGLPIEKLVQISRIGNIGLARQWVEFLKRKTKQFNDDRPSTDEEFNEAWWDSGMETYGPGASGIWGEMADRAYEYEEKIFSILDEMDKDYPKESLNYREKLHKVMVEGAFVEDLEELC